MNTREWKEELSNPNTGRKLMSDYGDMIIFIECLLKQVVARVYWHNRELGNTEELEELLLEFNIESK